MCFASKLTLAGPFWVFCMLVSSPRRTELCIQSGCSLPSLGFCLPACVPHFLKMEKMKTQLMEQALPKLPSWKVPWPQHHGPYLPKTKSSVACTRSSDRTVRGLCPDCSDLCHGTQPESRVFSSSMASMASQCSFLSFLVLAGYHPRSYKAKCCIEKMHCIPVLRPLAPPPLVASQSAS